MFIIKAFYNLVPIKIRILGKKRWMRKPRLVTIRTISDPPSSVLEFTISFKTDTKTSTSQFDPLVVPSPMPVMFTQDRAMHPRLSATSFSVTLLLNLASTSLTDCMEEQQSYPASRISLLRVPSLDLELSLFSLLLFLFNTWYC